VSFSISWVTILIVTKSREKDKKRERDGKIKGREKKGKINKRDGG
jgi:hypothetical protein